MASALLALTIVVRVYSPGPAAPQLDRALAEATGVLAGVVTPEWVRCDAAPAASLPSGRSAVCAAPLAPGELAVRFSPLPVPRGYTGRLPLGDSLIDAGRHSGVLATIYSNRVLWLAHAAATDPAHLLGRAIAHEIAHLLLGSHRHSEAGLMRAVWTREDVERDRPADWTLTRADAAAIRRRAIVRGAARQAAVNVPPPDMALQ
jgi:hypothetical protein